MRILVVTFHQLTVDFNDLLYSVLSGSGSILRHDHEIANLLSSSL